MNISQIVSSPLDTADDFMNMSDVNDLEAEFASPTPIQDPTGSSINGTKGVFASHRICS